MMIDPPETPTISGYIDGRSVYAGNVLSLTCTSVGGNPPATLTWLKGRHSQPWLPSVCIVLHVALNQCCAVTKNKTNLYCCLCCTHLLT